MYKCACVFLGESKDGRNSLGVFAEIKRNYVVSLSDVAHTHSHTCTRTHTLHVVHRKNKASQQR